MAGKEILMKTKIPREKGWLYYTSTSKKGNIILCRSKMGRGKKDKKSKKE